MKKFLPALLLISVACSHSTRTVSTEPLPRHRTEPARKPEPETRSSERLTGASTPRGAVTAFLEGVQAGDLQAMSVIFGTSRGPSRDNMDRSELDKRLVILQCYFTHDKFRIVDESAGEGAHRIVTTELTRGSNTRTPKFYVIQGPSNRWYVDNMEIAAVRDFCRK
ncbi:MAG: hypothetical protein ACRD3J_14480 [Thermoanaerobaculia bacterium]